MVLAMEEKNEYGFWFWSHKLKGILYMLAQLTKYELDEIKIDTIKYGLIDTNDELNQWTSYRFDGQKNNIEIELAYDAEESTDMIHIKIRTSITLKDKVEALDLFQSMFKELKLDC